MPTAAPKDLLPSAHVDHWPRKQLPPAEEWPVFKLEGRYEYPARLNAAERLLDDAVRDGHRSRPALITRNAAGEWAETSYGDLQKQADAIAHVLTLDLGLVPGNRVLLRGFNGRWMAAAWLATVKAGLVAVTTMPMLRAKELRVILERSQCQAALCDARLEDELREAVKVPTTVKELVTWGNDPEDAPHGLEARMATHTSPFAAVATSRDDVCLIAFTSGTTGHPKGCMHFHRDVIAMCDGFSAQVLHMMPSDRTIGTPPLAFTFGLGGLLCFPLAARGTAVLIEKATPETLLDAIDATGATVTFTAPTFYRQMAIALSRNAGRWSLNSLRSSVSAGEALPDATRNFWRQETRIEMLDGIGATELIHIFIAAADRDVRPGAIGRAVPGYEVAILDDQLQSVPIGMVGRLAVRGPTGCRYLNDPRQRDYVQGGWNITGDAAMMDADGYVYFKARTDDLILSSGYNIGAPEVESAVLQHESVAECAVVGVKDEDRGQAVKAFVVLKPGYEPSDALVRELQDFVKSNIAPYKYPRLVEFVAALPKTDTGKLQRFRLKETS